MSAPTVTVTLTEREIDELRTCCISIQMQLTRDKHANKEDIEWWYQLQDKLMMAKIRQIKK